MFVHDSEKACIWLIDFGKTVPLPSGLNIDHKSPWVVGNHEDGYLIGIDNLISIYTSLVAKLAESNRGSPHSELKFQKKSIFVGRKMHFLTFSKVQKKTFFAISKMAKNPFLHQKKV